MRAAVGMTQQVSAAIFYAVSSLLVIFINKLVLSSYGFPSFNFLGFCQFLTTALVTWGLRVTGRTQVKREDRGNSSSISS
jgi:solute carrier family 35